MLKSITSVLSFTAFVIATEEVGYQTKSNPAYNSYGAPQAAPAYSSYQEPAAFNSYQQPAAFNSYQQGYPAYGGYYRKTFPPPQPLIDPKFYHGVLIRFQQCIEHKCDKLSKDYTSTAAESVQAVGAYTACVTSCAASEMMRVVSEFKALVEKLFDVGSAHLNEARRYLAGEGDYDVLEGKTRIEDSCCLPNDYFVPWDEVLFAARIKFHGENDYLTRILTAKAYLDYCVQDKKSNDFWDSFIVECNPAWTEYFRNMQLNIGHLILVPKCSTMAPQGACTKYQDENPQSEEFSEDMCVAYECEVKGVKKTVGHAILKYPVKALTYEESCPCDKGDDDEVIVKYRRVPKQHLGYYPLSSGLPSACEEKCSYDVGLLKKGEEGEDVGRFGLATPPTESAIESLRKCPHSGRFEYCNVKQWVNWLQEQLFNFGGCPIVDMNKDDDDDDYNVPSDSPYTYYTLACLFRVVSLKCDCMQAVLNCYENEYEFTSELGKTLGKAASVLCGFILCQKPRVYSLLGGEHAISRANIMRHVLMQAGVLSPNVSSFPPASFAFLSFGLGMVCVLVLTKVTKKAIRTVGVEEGYRNLI